KRTRVRALARRQLGDETAVHDHALVQLPVRGGIITPKPFARTPTDAPPASSAAACAIASIPRAIPLTTTTPTRATPLARRRAASAPYAVWLRLPTTPTAGRLSCAASPQA